MDKAARERVLAVLLPTILIGAGYFMVFNRHKDLEAARADLAATELSALPPEAVGVQLVELEKLRKKQDELKADKARLAERRAELAAVGNPPPVIRTQALRRLSAMLWSQGLYPFEESPLEGEGQLSPMFDETVRKLVGTNSRGDKRLWQIRFYGRYSDVVATLETLHKSESPVIPISLTMSESKIDTDWRSWTLLLWI
ncbi:MAG: hypothetical protein JNL96_28120 [Planctomycetaceae bacterium]|nr:hypothetical protein [Planctomycetaceae bacterium]